MSDKIRVFIVDDTVIYRKILSDAVAALPDAEVVGAASNGVLALKKLAQVEADLALLDVFMPEMNGVETLRGIRKNFPSMAVVMISGATDRDADITIEALELGALDFIPKPAGMSQEESLQTLTDDLRRIIRLLNIRRWTRNAPGNRTAAAATTPKLFVRSPSPDGAFRPTSGFIRGGCDWSVDRRPQCAQRGDSQTAKGFGLPDFIGSAHASMFHGIAGGSSGQAIRFGGERGQG